VLQRFKIVSYSGQCGSSIAKRRSLEETAMISLNLGRLESGESYAAVPSSTHLKTKVESS
jgi:hypothetical protein